MRPDLGALPPESGRGDWRSCEACLNIYISFGIGLKTQFSWQTVIGLVSYLGPQPWSELNCLTSSSLLVNSQLCYRVYQDPLTNDFKLRISYSRTEVC